jgi:hypothetical protein
VERKDIPAFFTGPQPEGGRVGLTVGLSASICRM